MSVTALPAADQAYANLFDGVHQEVFFRKCAAAGIQPSTPQQAQHMLETAGKLRLLEQTKQASAEDPFAALHRSLDNVLAANGIDSGVRAAAAQSHDHEFRKIAAQLAADSTFYNSVLSLKAAEAAQIQQQLGAA